jgi:hypothetical protein
MECPNCGRPYLYEGEREIKPCYCHWMGSQLKGQSSYFFPGPNQWPTPTSNPYAPPTATEDSQ